MPSEFSVAEAMCMFVGYSEIPKAQRFWFSEDTKVILSANVHFFEDFQDNIGVFGSIVVNITNNERCLHITNNFPTVPWGKDEVEAILHIEGGTHIEN